MSLKNYAAILLLFSTLISCGPISMIGGRKVKIKNFYTVIQDTTISISYSTVNRTGFSLALVPQEEKDGIQSFEELTGNKIKLRTKSGNVILKIEKEGYLPKYVAYEKKTNAWYYVDLPIVLGAYGVAIYMGINNDFDFDALSTVAALGGIGLHHIIITSAKYKFPKKIKIPDQSFVKFPEKPKNTRYLIVDSIQFNTNEIQTRSYYNNYKRYQKERGGVFRKDRDLIFDTKSNRILKEDYFRLIPNKYLLNKQLYKSNYIDSSFVVKDKVNTLSLTFEINKITKHTVQNFASFEFDIVWVLKDYITNKVVASKEEKIRSSLLIDDFSFYKDYVNDLFLPKLAEIIEKNVMDIQKEDIIIENNREKLLDFSNSNPESIDLYNALLSSVTVVSESGHSSGFFVSNNGYVITSIDNVIGKSDLLIITNDQKEHKAELIRFSKKYGVALLKTSLENTPVLKPASQTEVRRGMDVYVIGTPKLRKFNQSLSKGVVSGIREKQHVELIQTDASINDGTIGGPMIDQNGNLIGVVNDKILAFEIEGIGFAVSIKHIEEALNIKF